MKPTKQQLQDESTIFVLATLMVNVYQSILVKDQKKTANMFLQVGQVLRRDPTFLGRLKKTQEAVLHEFNKIEAEEKAATPPPSVL